MRQCLLSSPLVLVLALAAGSAACTEEPERSGNPTVVEEKPPRLSAQPPPGVIPAYALSVTIAVSDSQAELLHAFDADPEPAAGKWSQGSLNLRITKSTSIRVLVRTASGRIWGPYAFEYALRTAGGTGGCRIHEPARIWYRGSEAIPLKVDYALPVALAKVELLVDGEVAAVLDSPEDAIATATLTLAALGTEKGYDVTCRVSTRSGVPAAGNLVRLYVDATPPAADWAAAGPDLPPTHYRVTASDAGAGLARAELCDAAFLRCLPMRAEDDGFLLATAFVPGAAAAFAGRARVFDAAGNGVTLTAPSFSALAVPPAAASYVHPVTLTASPAFNLAAALAAGGAGVPSEVRSLAFAPLPLTQQTLAAGWNELLFRRSGEVSWQTYGVYHAGVRVALPFAGPWLVYAGHATIPAMQATLAAQPVTGAVWAQAWLDVPNLFFVADANASGAWDDGEPLYLTAAPPAPWLGRGRPVATTLAAAVTRTAATPRAADIACADCANGPALVLQRRDEAHGAPVGRRTWTGLAFTAGLITAQAYEAEDGEHCLFVWDEDGNGIPSGGEPRGAGACGAGPFTLRRAETAALAVTASGFTLDGIPFGGTVTGAVEVRDSAGALLTDVPLDVITDFDGTGRRTVPLPAEAAWPGTLLLWPAGATLAAALPGAPAAGAATTAVEVRDAANALVAAAVEAWTPSIVDHRVFDPAVTQWTGLTYDPQYRPRLRALRDGFLSEWSYLDATAGTLRVLSGAGVGSVSGYVLDGAGGPVTGAVVEWDADPYFARTRSGADGSFVLPSLGAGRLRARRGGRRAEVTASLAVNAGESLLVNLRVPPSDAPAWPAGTAATLVPEAVSGPAAAALYFDGLFAWSPLPAGEWAVHSGRFSRRFEAPGALPGIALGDAAWLALYWSPELAAASHVLRCGAREQAFAFGDPLIIDAPCWDWYARPQSSPYEFYVGRPDPQGGAPLAGLRSVVFSFSWYGVALAFQPVTLVDRLFNRTLVFMTDAQGVVAAVLPHGYYEAESAGQKFRGAAAVHHTSLSNEPFVFP